MDNIVFTDRYQALGIPYPDPTTMCRGHCEGTGVYPQKCWDFNTPAELHAWTKAHSKSCTTVARVRRFVRGLLCFDWYDVREAWNGCDGWHFIQCADCGGTGKVQATDPNAGGTT